ncbi:alpha/beta fold hydrolase [Burkholderia gladioli]|uniref:alpha/beta fold hydrolase n=1 Tax=Burkholderia gladioli TaxID=28095 RepID=UPI001641A696|nr:alpha/beta hydrolase [Burkholderia gladioli]
MKIKQVLMGALMTFGVVEGLAGGAAAQAATTAAASAAAAPVVSHHYVQVDDVKVFYREAGNPSAPTILLLHGFPTSSFMYRELIPRLADRYHVIAPDLPGFGFTQSPDRAHYAYTFDHLAQTIDHFTETLHLDKYALQVFDYGAPVGWRLAVAHPERVTAIVTQNGNAYVEGLSDGWNPIQKYWKDPSQENRDALREFLKPEAIKWQYTHGVKDPDQIAPEAYTLDAAFVARPGNDEIQLDLFGDYASNVARYPEFQAYFRKYQPPVLAVWGKNDPFFLPPGAEAFKRDLPKAEVHFYDTGHFALETNIADIAPVIHHFLDRNVPRR